MFSQHCILSITENAGTEICYRYHRYLRSPRYDVITINTRAFLREEGREEDFKELLPDADARYNKIVQIDLFRVEPLDAQILKAGGKLPWIKTKV